ncbi:hypothetical protein ABTZ58_18935 [Streptomyces sp. NPDC094143]
MRDQFPLAYDEPVDAWLVSRYRGVRAAPTDARFTSASYGWQSAPIFGRR